MKVLHLFSNSKWTGPAEPALNLCVALRRLGVEADFACAPQATQAVNKIVTTARDRGIEPVLDLRLSKHRRPVKNFLDSLTLSPLLRRGAYEVVHCHLDNDHRIALGPCARLGVPLVRSSYYGEGLPRHAARLLKGTMRLIEPSTMAFEHDTKALGFPEERMRVIPGAVDLERFDPAREVPDGRSWLRIPRDAFVVGIIARLQRHRRYEDFFEAVRRLVEHHPNTHALIIGRGTHQESVGKAPVEALGLEEHVHFTGYLDGDDFVGMLKAFDVKVFLVPGSDGTCRAVREAMALARPVVAADRGMLREIVDDGESGLICNGTADGLYSALRRLCDGRQFARGLGHAARAKAEREYSLETQARRVLDVYQEVINEGRNRA